MISLRKPIWPTALAAACLSAAFVACGGKVVVDQGSEIGGAGGTTSTGTGGLGGAGGIGGAGGCDALLADFQAKLDAAQACNPLINAIQCSGTVVAFDTCGCEVVANDQASTAASYAIGAYESWADAGCGPYDCALCPPPPSSPWFCDPATSKCQPAWEK